MGMVEGKVALITGAGSGMGRAGSLLGHGSSAANAGIGAVGESTKSKGWQAALDRYKKTYQGAGHEMGKLEFANLRIETLGPEAAFVRGEFHLTMSDRKTPHGLFTLVFRKFPEGWKIVHDHSAGE